MSASTIERLLSCKHLDNVRGTLALTLFFALFAHAGATELVSSFPNHAFEALPLAGPRETSRRTDDFNTPFSWDQTAVVYEGQGSSKTYFAFDPGFQPLLINVLPATPTHLRVTFFDGNFGVQTIQALPMQAGNLETFQFTATARGITSDISNFTYDIRAANSKIRTAPAVSRSGNAYVSPGQVVRYTWTATTNEKFAKCEAALVGRTGPAKGLLNSTVTQVLAVKVVPKVLGHYLMLVTPRDVRGQPPLGSNGNGVVFRCVFGTDNLPPVTDGFLADTFTPAVNQTITLQPNATDPETGQTTFANQLIEFGDGQTQTASGATTHAYAVPGIYRVRGTVADDQNLTATAEDSVVVGATHLTSLAFTFVKEIPPEEAGDGLNQSDQLAVTFRDLKGAKVNAGDRIVFLYNRNHFGRLSTSDHADDTDIVLSRGLNFNGATRIAHNISVTAGGGVITVKVLNAQFDRTGDPRFGRCELSGIFKNQRIALAIIPADGSTPRALLYTGNMQAAVTGGVSGRFLFVPETNMHGMATLRQPNPNLQEP